MPLTFNFESTGVCAVLGFDLEIAIAMSIHSTTPLIKDNFIHAFVNVMTS